MIDDCQKNADAKKKHGMHNLVPLARSLVATGLFDLNRPHPRKTKNRPPPPPKAILVAGVGFFSDAYDLFIIGLAKPAIGVVYFPDHGGKLPTNVDLAITGVSLIGALTGQMVFG